MKCTACGAALGPAEPTCRFCGAITTYGHEQQARVLQEQAQARAWHLHREHEQAVAKRQDASRSLKRTSDASLWWGIGAIVTCCLFVPGAVAIVLGFRARKMAQKYDLVIPTNATLGLILGFASLGLGAFFIGLGIHQDYQRDSTIAEIDEQLGGKLDKPELEHRSACLLAKRSLLKGEYQDSTNAIDDFDCDGKLTLSGDTAVLHDVRFKRSGDRHQLRVCLERGARWRVIGFRLGGGCDEPDDTKQPGSGVSGAPGSGTEGAVESATPATSPPAPSAGTKEPPLAPKK